MRLCAVGCLAILVVAAAPALAGPAVQGAHPARTGKAEIISELHVTSNALDGPDALADLGWKLRGAVEGRQTTELGVVGLSLTADLWRYDRYPLEDDSTVSAELSFASEAEAPLAVAASASYSYKDEGDDFPIAGLRLATRTVTDTVAGTAGLTWRLGAGLSADARLAASYEAPRETRFSALFVPEKLSPDRLLLVPAVGLGWRGERIEARIDGEVLRARLPRAGALPDAVAFDGHALRGSLGIAAGGWVLGAEIGLQRLRDGEGIADVTRPLYALAAARALGPRADVKARLSGRFETEDTDDPLATYRHRFSLEAGYALDPATRFSAGAFFERGDNILLENEEIGSGAYLAVSRDINARLSLLMRFDYARTRYTVIDVVEETVAGFVGARARL